MIYRNNFTNSLFFLEILDLHAVSMFVFLMWKYFSNIFKAFWDDFPSGRMDKKGFVRYYEEIKDENDRTSVLCEYVSSSPIRF